MIGILSKNYAWEHFALMSLDVAQFLWDKLSTGRVLWVTQSCKQFIQFRNLVHVEWRSFQYETATIIATRSSAAPLTALYVAMSTACLDEAESFNWSSRLLKTNGTVSMSEIHLFPLDIGMNIVFGCFTAPCDVLPIPNSHYQSINQSIFICIR